MNASIADFIPNLLQGAVLTIVIAASSWAIATGLGFVFALIQRSRYVVVRGVNDFVTTCLRGLPQLVVIYLVYFGLGQIGFDLSPFLAAVIALGVTEASFTAEVFRSGFATVGHRRVEAAQSLGLSGPQIVGSVELPILMRFATAPLLNSFVGLIKLSTLASAIGVGELLYQGRLVITRTYQIVEVSLLLIVLYLIFTVPITRSVTWIEQRMRAKIA